MGKDLIESGIPGNRRAGKGKETHHAGRAFQLFAATTAQQPIKVLPLRPFLVVCFPLHIEIRLAYKESVTYRYLNNSTFFVCASNLNATTNIHVARWLRSHHGCCHVSILSLCTTGR